VSPSTLLNTLLGAFQGGAGTSAPPAAGAAQRLAGARVLVVEDNAINRDVARGLLEKAGVQVTLAGSGAEALRQLNGQPFDLVLMDVQMPEIDGYETTRLMRQNPAWRNLPVIAMTAHAMVTDREKSLAAGMNDHISKPVNPPEMYAILARWLSARSNPAETDIMLPEPGEAPLQLAVPQILNTVRGQDHVGSETDYRRLLTRFQVNYANLGKLRAALVAGDIQLASLEAHSLRGAAGTLGAEVLQQSARALEIALRQGPPTPWETLADQLERDLADTLAAMAAVDPSGKDIP
jgi:CheY-like chemotaxis protein